MCGIAGYSAALGREVSHQDLDGAVKALSHRGPDGRGVFLENSGRVGLAHTRLAIIAPSEEGRQPMISDDGMVVLVFNGEIYNYREIRQELVAVGVIFGGLSDTEVLLRLYLSLGNPVVDFHRVLRRLNGIFAFAIWDARYNCTFVVRDGVGVKPLYYRVGENGVGFASEIKAIPEVGGMGFAGQRVGENAQIDLASIDRYLTFLWCPGDGTPLKDVKKLLPGHAMRIVNGEVSEVSVWYQLPAQRARPMVQTDSGISGDLVEANFDQAYFVSETDKLLRQAVHRQMVADAPLGAFLSGGLDSSAIVAYAREVNPDIRCFTVGLIGGAEDGVADDLPFAQRAASHLGVPLDVVMVDGGNMANDLPELIAQLDEPLADPAALNVLYISQAAREQGIKVLLSGVGADDLFTGYRRHQALAYERYWQWLPRSCKLKVELASQCLNTRRPWTRKLRKLLSGVSLEGDRRLTNYFRWAERHDLEKLYVPDLLGEFKSASAELPMLEFLDSALGARDDLDRMLLLEQRFFLSDHNLIYTDKMSMAAGVEVRVPFLDPDLIDFSFSVPNNYKIRVGESKWILRKVAERYLPREIIYRSKTGFGAPVRRWVNADLREMIRDVLGRDSIQRRGLFDPDAVGKMIDDNYAGRLDASYTLLSLLCIELWCRNFIDRQYAVKNEGVA